MAPAMFSFHLAHLSRVGLIQGRGRGASSATPPTTPPWTNCWPSTAIAARAAANACPRPGLPTPSPSAGAASLQKPLPAREFPKPKRHDPHRPRPGHRQLLPLPDGRPSLNHDLAGRGKAVSPAPAPAQGSRRRHRSAEAGPACPRKASSQGRGYLARHPHRPGGQRLRQRPARPAVFPRPVQRIHVPLPRSPRGAAESFVTVRDDIRTRLVAAVREALAL